MKKLLSLILVLCLIAFITVPIFADEAEEEEEEESYNTSAEATGVTINVYNWGEYIANGSDGSLDINAAFTEATGIGVNYTTFDTNESLYAKLVSGAASYDVIIPSDYMVSKLIDEGMLAELNYDNIPNFQYVDEEFLYPDYDTENLYSVPYTWGLVGIFYNKNYVEEPTSWDVFWNEEYSGKILMFDNARDAFAIAQSYLGFSMNSEDESEWEEAAMKLKEQKSLVQAYVMDQIFDKMESGEAWIAPYYSGDAAILVEENEDIGFVYPEEGTNYFVDAMCVPVTSTYQAEAEAYINFLTDPEIAGANMDYVGYATPISAAKEYLDPEVLENEIFYPSSDVIANTEVFVNLSDDLNVLIEELWIEVKMGEESDSIVLVLILLGFLAVYIGIIIYKKQKIKREKA